MTHRLFDPAKSGQRVEIIIDKYGKVVSITIVGSGNSQKGGLCERAFFENIKFPHIIWSVNCVRLELKTLSKLK